MKMKRKKKKYIPGKAYEWSKEEIEDIKDANIYLDRKYEKLEKRKLNA
jgi:hypothetical protein